MICAERKNFSEPHEGWRQKFFWSEISSLFLSLQIFRRDIQASIETEANRKIE